jgi:hypothetical protein
MANPITIYIVSKMSDTAAAAQIRSLDRDLSVLTSPATSAVLRWSLSSNLTTTARDALVKAVTQVLSAWLLPPEDSELFNRPEEVYARL